MKNQFKNMLILLSLLSIVGCSTNKEEDSYNEIKNKGTFIVGFTDFPPMGYFDKGIYKGFDLELAKEVGKKLNVEVKFQYIDWDAKVFELNSRAIDCVWNGMTITPTRLQEMTFSKSYFENTLVILQKNNGSIQSLQDLKDKKVGVELTSSSDIALGKDPIKSSIKEISKFTTSNEALLALSANTIDAIVVDEIYARYHVMLQQPDVFRLISTTLSSEEYGIGFRKGDEKLKNKVDEALDQLAEEGVCKEISMNYFGKDLFKR